MFELGFAQIGDLFSVPATAAENPSYIFFDGVRYTLSGEPINKVPNPPSELVRRFILQKLVEQLTSKGFSFRTRRVPSTVYRMSDEVQHKYSDFFRIYNGFEFRVAVIKSSFLLCLNPRVVIRSEAPIAKYVAEGIALGELSGFAVKYDTETEAGIDGFLLSVANHNGSLICQIKDYRLFQEIQIGADKVKPEPRSDVLQKLGDSVKIDLGVMKLQRQLAYMDSPVPSRRRFADTLELAKRLARDIFPLTFGNFSVDLNTVPAAIVI